MLDKLKNLASSSEWIINKIIDDLNEKQQLESKCKSGITTCDFSVKSIPVDSCCDVESEQDLVFRASEIDKNISFLKKDISPLKKDISSLKKDISPLKKDISSLNKEISSLKKNMLTQWKEITKAYSEKVEPVRSYPTLNTNEGNLLYMHLLIINFLMHYTDAVDTYLLEVKEKNPAYYPDCVSFYDKSLLKKEIIDGLLKNEFGALDRFVRGHLFEKRLTYFHKIIQFFEIVHEDKFRAMKFLRENFEDEKSARPFLKALVGREINIDYKRVLINELHHVFKRNYDVPPNIPILSLYEAGALSFPVIAGMCKNSGLMQCARGDELPIELPIPRDMKYHSFFVCPVLRVRCGSDNKPVLLKCGHVVSEKAVTEISRSRNRFKCPYCPVVSLLTDLVGIKL